MKIYNRYILLIAILLLLTTIILVALGTNSLNTYYTVYVVEALIVTELYVHFNAKARQALNLVSILLFGGFLMTVTLQVIRILS